MRDKSSTTHVDDRRSTIRVNDRRSAHESDKLITGFKIVGAVVVVFIFILYLL